MPQKSRFTTEGKIKIVETYLRGETSKNAIGKEYGISLNTLSNWIRMYQHKGAEGLTPSATICKYPVEIKRKAVEDYLSGKGSLEDVCSHYAINDNRVLRRWIKRYNSHEDFKQPKSGGAIYMAKGRKTTHQERIEIVSYCIAVNKDYGKAIERYNVSYQQIYSWVRKYEALGIDGLQDSRGKRRASSEMSEVESLYAQIKLKDAEVHRLQMENDLLKKLDELERGRGVN